MRRQVPRRTVKGLLQLPAKAANVTTGLTAYLPYTVITTVPAGAIFPGGHGDGLSFLTALSGRQSRPAAVIDRNALELQARAEALQLCGPARCARPAVRRASGGNPLDLASITTICRAAETRRSGRLHRAAEQGRLRSMSGRQHPSLARQSAPPISPAGPTRAGLRPSKGPGRAGTARGPRKGNGPRDPRRQIG